MWQADGIADMLRGLSHSVRTLSLAVVAALACATVQAGAQAPTQKGRTGLDATAEAEVKRFREVVSYFRTYGSQYNLDWMLMAAQGYQESRLNQQAKSHVGAVGVMQIMPATGKELNVGDITMTEADIHGGVKYIRFMIDRYYQKEPMDDLNKVLFAFAAYNCGPGRVRQLRREAAARGLDANVWFDHVERVAAEKIGRETVTYASNIYKYYVSYLLVQGEYIQRRELKKKSAISDERP